MPKINRYWNSDPDSLVEREPPQTYDLCKCCELVNQLVLKEKRLKRALWLARASEAVKEVNYWTCQDESSYAIVDFNVRHETIVSYKAPHHRPYKWILIWENVERKCLKKAEEYK